MVQNVAELERVDDLLRRNRLPEAVELLRVMLTQTPEDPELRRRLGEAYRAQGNKERAFDQFRKAAAIYTKRADTYGTVRMLRAANGLLPGEPDVLFRLAEGLKNLGPAAELETVLRQLVGAATMSGDRRRLWALDTLVNLCPEDLELAIQHAVALAESSRFDDALQAWRQLRNHLDHRDVAAAIQRTLQVAGEQPALGAELARVLLIQKRPRDSLQILVRYYESFPEHVGLLEVLLQTLETLGANDKLVPTRIELIKARTKAGQRQAALRDISALLMAAQDDPMALEVSASACHTFGLVGDACRLWLQMAQVAHKRGLADKRDKALAALLKANPDHVQGLAFGAQVLRAAGRLNEAGELERRLAQREANAPTERGHATESEPIASKEEATRLARPEPRDPRVAEALRRPARAPVPTPQGTQVISDADVLDETLDAYLVKQPPASATVSGPLSAEADAFSDISEDSLLSQATVARWASGLLEPAALSPPDNRNASSPWVPDPSEAMPTAAGALQSLVPLPELRDDPIRDTVITPIAHVGTAELAALRLDFLEEASEREIPTVARTPARLVSDLLPQLQKKK